jgi:hypothetical protein
VWQKEMTPLLAKASFIPDPCDFGYFRALQLLWPHSRRKKVESFVKDYTEECNRLGAGTPSIIAHSYGTYIAGEAMLKYPEIKFDRMILCGAILPTDFPWDELAKNGQVNAVLNQYGGQDFWAWIVAWVVDDAGQSGRYGFKSQAACLTQLAHPEFRHSDYFYDLNCEQNWVPFLNGEKPHASPAIEPPGRVNWRFMTSLIVVFALVVALGFYLGRIWDWRSFKANFDGQQAPFHEIWDPILEGANSIPIVIGGIRAEGFTPIGTDKPVRLPRNVLLVGVEDGAGMSLLRESLVRAFGRNKRPTLHQPDDFGDNIKTSFVSVGGPSVNKVTGRILAYTIGIQMVYPADLLDDPYAMIGQRKFSAEQDPQGNVTKDVGFIIVKPNPFAPDHTVCVVFGIWPYGTSAALEELSTPDMTNTHFKEFVRQAKLHAPFVAVVETKVEGLQHGTPDLVEVDPLPLK